MLVTTWSYTYPNLDIVCIKLSSINYLPGRLLGREPLWFNSCKQPPPITDHSVFAFWVVAYGRFDCITLDSLLTDTSVRWTPLEVKQTSRVGPWRSKIADCWWRWFFFSDQMCPVDGPRLQQPGFWAYYLWHCKCCIHRCYYSSWVNQII